MKNKILAVVLSVLIALSVLSAVVGAEEEKNGYSDMIIDSVDPALLKKIADIAIDSFNMPTIRWSGSCSAEETFDSPPYLPYEGSRSLEFSGKITCNVDGSLDSVKYFSATLFPREDMTLTFGAEGSAFSYYCSASLIGGKWQTVLFNLTDENCIISQGKPKSSRKKIDSISLEIPDELSVVADMCIGTNYEEFERTASFLCESFIAENGTVFFNNGAYVFSFGSGGYFMGIPYQGSFEEGTAIAFTIENNSDSDSLILEYTTATGVKKCEQPIISGKLPQYVIFPVRSGNISEIKFIPSGALGGEMIITSIKKISSLSTSDTVGSTLSCTVSSDRKTIVFRSSPGTSFDGCEAYLFAFNATERINLSGKVALAQTSVSGGVASFSIPIGTNKDELFKMYVSAIDFGDNLIIVGSPFYPSGAELFATDSDGFLPASSKGSGIVDGEYIADFLSHFGKIIYLDEILVSDNGSLSVNAEFSEKLKKEFQSYSREKILVTVFLRWRKTGDPSTDRLILDDFGLPKCSAIRAVCTYLAESFGRDNSAFCLNGAVIGEKANTGLSPLLDISEAVFEYSDILFTAYSSMKSVNSSLNVFLPIGGKWHNCSGVTAHTNYPADEFLCFLNLECRKRNFADYSVAYDIWDGKGTESFLSEYMCSDNLSLLCSALDFYGYRGNMLCGGEYSSSGNDLILDSAEYVKINSDITDKKLDICAVIPFHPCNYGNTLRYTDSNVIDEKLSYVSEIYGAQVSNTLSKVKTDAPRHLFESDMISIVPSSVKGTAPIFNFENSEDGFVRSDYCSELLFGVTLGETKGIMSAVTSKSESKAFKGVKVNFDTPIDLSTADYLSVEAMLSKTTESNDAPFILILRSGNNAGIYSGTIADGQFSLLVADLSTFKTRNIIDSLEIYVLTDEEPSVLIKSVNAMSDRLSANEIIDSVRKSEPLPAFPIEKIILASALAVLCVVAETVRLAKRNKNNSQEEQQ